MTKGDPCSPRRNVSGAVELEAAANGAVES